MDTRRGYEKGVQILRKRHSEDMVKVAKTSLLTIIYLGGTRWPSN